MASRKAHVDNLRNVPLFRGCTSKELDRIARSGDEVRMTAGTLLADQGQTVIVVTHDPALAARADRRIHIVDGKVAEIMGRSEGETICEMAS